MELTGPRRQDGLARAGENVPCTARPGQDSLPLGVRWLSDGLGGAGGRGWEEHGATVPATGLGAENKERESARPTVGEQVTEPAGSRAATEGDQRMLASARKWDCGIGSLPAVSGADKLKRYLHATGAVWLTPNVRANRTAAAGRLGPGWENVPCTPGRAKLARRSGSGGSARGNDIHRGLVVYP